MKTQTVSQLEPRAAATVAGEDLACGDKVGGSGALVFPSRSRQIAGARVCRREVVRPPGHRRYLTVHPASRIRRNHRLVHTQKYKAIFFGLEG